MKKWLHKYSLQEGTITKLKQRLLYEQPLFFGNYLFSRLQINSRFSQVSLL